MPSVVSDAASIYYERTGRGPSVVFAHGAGGNAMSWWQQIPVFAARHTVIAFDHRCFGRSTCPPDAFHPQRFASDLLAILNAEGIERAALVCQSMGGWTGLYTALNHPDCVSALVLCGTPGGVLTEAVATSLAKVGERIGSEGIQSSAALAPDYPARSPEMTFLYDRIGSLNTGVDVSLLGRLFEPDARVDPAALSGLRAPTLVVAGAADQLFPPEVLRELAGRIPGAEYCQLEAGHSTYFESPSEFNARVGAFLAKHVLP